MDVVAKDIAVMDIVVVDDESLARQRLLRMLADEPGYRVVAEAANTEQALAAVLREDPDIVLLDIHMPGESGLQAARQLAAMEDAPAVIFCTAYDQHALDAFGVNAVDYLLKPVRKPQLLAALAKARSPNKAQRQALHGQPLPAAGREHISARSRGGVELIPLQQIYYFAADQKYVTVFHAQGETLIDESLKELETEFGQRFVRIHRNALVPVKRIEAMEKGSGGQYYLRLVGTELQPQVSRRHVSRLRELLNRL